LTKFAKYIGKNKHVKSNASYYILESLCETPINKRDKGLTLTKSAVTIASSVCVPGNHIAY